MSQTGWVHRRAERRGNGLTNQKTRPKPRKPTMGIIGPNRTSQKLKHSLQLTTAILPRRSAVRFVRCRQKPTSGRVEDERGAHFGGGPDIARRAPVSRNTNVKMVACAHLDRIEEARAALRQLIGSLPELTIACFTVLWSWAFLPQRTATFVDGLRKAGLPEE